MQQCPSCSENVENLYDCPNCSVNHCVDCRLPDEHNCEPPQTKSETESDDPKELVGFSAWQWTATFIWTFLVLIGGPLPGDSMAGLVGGILGAFLGSMAIVWAVSAVYAKLKSVVGGLGNSEENSAES